MPEAVAPRDAAEAAQTLAQASRDRRRVAIRGGGTKLDAMAALTTGPWPVLDIIVGTNRMNAIVAHRPGDLTATVQGGAVLADVNRELARHGQWIALDPPWSDRATIGGIVAANDSGPRRHRYGGPRDLIIGVEIVRADGIVAKAGGVVVKNVAGYDLSRLVTGSYGSLGVITAATFKLSPIPPASRTVVVRFTDDDRDRSAEALTLQLMASQLTPTAIELHAPPLRLLVRFESIDASVRHQSEAAADLARRAGAEAAILEADAESRAWADHPQLWERPGAVARVTLLPSTLAATLDCIRRNADDVDWEVAGRAALGVLFLRVNGEPAAQARLLSAVRARFAPGQGSLVLLRGSQALGAAVGVWGSIGDAFDVMRAVKRAFDPANVLNPGLGPGGL
jgi:glycolate dehydrogenase FAD-binding subunit